MKHHYTQPKGFVGRNICYLIQDSGLYYGAIVSGSATLHLPGRDEFFTEVCETEFHINQIINNIFFHVTKVHNKYPERNFVPRILKEWRKLALSDWETAYGDKVIGFESLVELPRTGEIYKRDGWTLVGQTKGYTCKRTGGKGTDSWSGKRVWDTENLRPKLVFVRAV